MTIPTLALAVLLIMIHATIVATAELCKDMEGETRISIAGKPATCAQLAPYCKLPQYKKRVSQFCPKTCGDCKTCPNEFRGLSCDDLGQYQFTCSALRKRYNFTCANCECKIDGAGCDDDPCDTWGSVYGYSCPALEQVGYNCKGCKCAVRPPKDTGNKKCIVANPAFLGDNHCESKGKYNTKNCGWDHGDCCMDTCGAGLYHNEKGEEVKFVAKRLFVCGKAENMACKDPHSTDKGQVKCKSRKIKSLGNGHCDMDGNLNTKACDWDGGDCCDDTCRNGKFSCKSNDRWQCRDPNIVDHGTGTCKGRCQCDPNFACDSKTGRNTDKKECCIAASVDCLCDDSCEQYGDCCADYKKQCQSKSDACDVMFKERIGDGFCQGRDYNTEACRWDGGDCCPSTCKESTDIKLKKRGTFVASCPDTFKQCKDPAQQCPYGQDDQSLGDGLCDSGTGQDFNTAKCDWDGGDCCKTTCKQKGKLPCGTWGYTCLDPKINPMEEYKKSEKACRVGDPSFLGDRVCDLWGNYNTKSCGYDHGDCCMDTCEGKEYHGVDKDGNSITIPKNTKDWSILSGRRCTLGNGESGFKTLSQCKTACTRKSDCRFFLFRADTTSKTASGVLLNENCWLAGKDDTITKKCPIKETGFTVYTRDSLGKCGDTPYICKDTTSSQYGEQACPKSYNKYRNDGICNKYGGYNSKVCGWDGGDCCKSTCKGKDCGSKGFECFDPDVSGYEKQDKCKNKVAYVEWVGNSHCDGGDYNTHACDWDGGDCCAMTCADDRGVDTGVEAAARSCRFSPFKCKNPAVKECKVADSSLLGNGECDGASYNVEECKWDGGDCCFSSCDTKCDAGHCDKKCGSQGYSCLDPKYKDTQKTGLCNVGYTSSLGDGFCDLDGDYNSKACNWDHGDCCPDTCKSNARDLLECNSNSYICKDPHSKYRNQSSCAVEDANFLGDGFCDDGKRGYNTKICNWDGGDCCEPTCGAEWTAISNKRCTLGSGQSIGGRKKLTLQECKDACNDDCPFFLFHPNSIHEDNCWTANKTHRIAKDCKRNEPLYTVYTRTWVATPKKRCFIGDGEQGHISLDECKARCGADCPFFLYHASTSAFHENCWTASRAAGETIATKCVDSQEGFTVFQRKSAAKTKYKCDTSQDVCANTDAKFFQGRLGSCANVCPSNGPCVPKAGVSCKSSDKKAPCRCDAGCVKTGDCCYDYDTHCLTKQLRRDCNATFAEWAGDGNCDSDDESLNTQRCDWDGGDCCQSTCRNTQDSLFKCGTAPDDFKCLDPLASDRLVQTQRLQSDGWMSFSNTRCHLGAGLPDGHRSLDQCKAACSHQIDCTFFLFNKKSKYNENCWIAKKSHTMSSDCVIESGSWTVYKPVAVDRSGKWNLLPSKKCTLGDGEQGSMSVDACAKACSNNGCPFFIYNPVSPYNENCWTASKGDKIAAKCTKDGYGYFLYMRPAPIRGWNFMPNTKCNIGDGEKGVTTVVQCARACGADCPFFLYHPRSPHKERCWTAKRTQNVGRDCAYGAGYVLYQREAKKISAPTTIPKKNTGTTAAPEFCVSSKEVGNGVCDTKWNYKKCSWDGGDCCPSTCQNQQNPNGKCAGPFDCRNSEAPNQKSNTPSNPKETNAGVAAAVVIVVLLVLAGLGAGAFIFVRKFMYRKGQPEVRPKKKKKKNKQKKKKNFARLQDADDEEIVGLTAHEKSDEEEDDDPMGTLLSHNS